MHRILEFLRYVIGRFHEDRGLQAASALSFTVILALVPLVAVTFYALSGFPVFHALIGRIHDFIFTNFVPATGVVVQKYLEQFAQKAANLTTVGVLLLFVTALMVMETVDQSMNDIWRIKVKRRRITSFLVYWAVLTLGPLLVGLSIVSTSYLASLPVMEATFGSQLKGILFSLLAFVFTVTAFTLLYTLVPNYPVRLRHALLGAVSAAVLFEAAKKGFALYVTHVPTYAVIYGSLAAIPIFLFWVYISWVIILLGAELTYCAGHARDRHDSEADLTGQELIASFRILGHLAQAQRQGNTLSVSDLLSEDPELNESFITSLLDILQTGKLIHCTLEGDWALSRDSSALTLHDLYRALPPAFPKTAGPWSLDHPWNRALFRVLSDANASLDRVMDIPLVSLYDFERHSPDGAYEAPHAEDHGGRKPRSFTQRR